MYSNLYVNIYILYFLAAVLFAAGFATGAFVFVRILKGVEKRRARRALRRKWKAAGGTLAGRGNRVRTRERKESHKKKAAAGPDPQTAPSVSIRDRMVDKSDSRSKFNAAAEGIDEEEYIELRRSRQDRAYNYARRKGSRDGKED